MCWKSTWHCMCKRETTDIAWTGKSKMWFILEMSGIIFKPNSLKNFTRIWQNIMRWKLNLNLWSSGILEAREEWTTLEIMALEGSYRYELQDNLKKTVAAIFAF